MIDKKIYNIKKNTSNIIQFRCDAMLKRDDARYMVWWNIRYFARCQGFAIMNGWSQWPLQSWSLFCMDIYKSLGACPFRKWSLRVRCSSGDSTFHTSRVTWSAFSVTTFNRTYCTNITPVPPRSEHIITNRLGAGAGATAHVSHQHRSATSNYSVYRPTTSKIIVHTTINLIILRMKAITQHLF